MALGIDSVAGTLVGDRSIKFGKEGASVSQPLRWKLFIRKRASATQGVPPDKDDLKWVANTTTLIYGEQEALLVDTFLSDAQTAELADWIATTGWRLSTIYITHAHRSMIEPSVSKATRSSPWISGIQIPITPHVFTCHRSVSWSRATPSTTARIPISWSPMDKGLTIGSPPSIKSKR